jgi:hypothetical protein
MEMQEVKSKKARRNAVEVRNLDLTYGFGIKTNVVLTGESLKTLNTPLKEQSRNCHFPFTRSIVKMILHRKDGHVTRIEISILPNI